MEIPASIDSIQKHEGLLEIPEIRVWCHPHRININKEDYYEVFQSFTEALEFIKQNENITEKDPLIAFRGYEINIFDIESDIILPSNLIPICKECKKE